MMEISLIRGADTLVLNGSGAWARFVDAPMRTLEVSLAGDAAGAAGWVGAVSRMLDEAARAFAWPGEERGYVQVALEDGQRWRSPYRGGRVEMTRNAAGRGLKTPAMHLCLEREDWWETAEPVYAALRNRHGESIGAGGLTVYNHKDASHDNYVDVAYMEGDLPAPAVLKISGAGMGGVEAFCGMGSFLMLDDFQVRYEGEGGSSGAGVTATLLADTACAGGSFAALSWAGTVEVMVRRWSVSRAEAGALAGRVFLPLLRLQEAVMAGESLWLSWQVGFNNLGDIEVIWQGEAVLVPAGRQMVVFPAMQLPPWPAPAGSAESLELCLLAQAQTGGGHTLRIDQVLLLPTDSFLRLVPVLSGYPQFDIEYTSGGGFFKNGGRACPSHEAEGPGLWLVPGRVQRLVFAFRQGNEWNINHAPLVNLLVRPRRRVI
ncbi:hypothetical protein ATHL_03449 [Anaerolinea thermolimosa]|uniref:Uncharacterized protein n=1 Tax=Anaerolinea thermolimosa TaxID=229919 RepID=A0A7U9KME4_9CHLR|nr:hypothetical protein [Anaerolinea thermolimosa]GAP08544.1 hypothetical protein ATHL_03449 [Anaerolinea thermolimosa]